MPGPAVKGKRTSAIQLRGARGAGAQGHTGMVTDKTSETRDED